MAAAGNDFLLVDDRAGKLANLPQLAQRLCDRKRSVGGDGLILLGRSRKADVRMRIFNPDGSEAEMCGNGVRCLAHFALAKKAAKKSMSVETQAGTVLAEVKGDVVKARLTDPKELRRDVRLALAAGPQKLSVINTGVPHAVVLVDSVEGIDVDGTGREIRRHKDLGPRGANANFVARRRDGGIDVRTYERGVEGETLACGTGSTAAALVAAVSLGLKSPVIAHTRGGETLKIHFSRQGNSFTDVFLEGRVTVPFEGRVIS